MGLLFRYVPEDDYPGKHDRPRNDGNRHRERRAANIEKADGTVVVVFVGLQKVWRRQGTLRRTYDGMPSSREERVGWRQLIQYLSALPPPTSCRMQ